MIDRSSEENHAKDFVAAIDNYRAQQEKRRKQLERPSLESDLLERKFVANQFPEIVKAHFSEVPFRFHGTLAHELPAILESAELTSAVDRGVQASFDLSGHVSVTAPNNIVDTIGSYEKALQMQQQGTMVKSPGYIDISSHESPLGCIFMLLPMSEQEAQRGENGLNVIGNTKLKSNQFSALLISDEFLPTARKLLELYGYDPELAITYRELEHHADELKSRAKKNFPYIENYKANNAQTGLTLEF